VEITHGLKIKNEYSGEYKQCFECTRPGMKKNCKIRIFPDKVAAANPYLYG
jgi:hypothetical protein